MAESRQAAEIRLAAGETGYVNLQRNNSGALMDRTGRLVRFGLGNESAAVNKRLKSSDFVGIRRVLIRPEHVGCVIGQFLAIETKDLGFTGPTNTTDEHVQAQYRWQQLMRSWGARVGFASTVEEARIIWDGPLI